MVPRSLISRPRRRRPVWRPVALGEAARKPALTYAASSTPGDAVLEQIHQRSLVALWGFSSCSTSSESPASRRAWARCSPRARSVDVRVVLVARAWTPRASSVLPAMQQDGLHTRATAGVARPGTPRRSSPGSAPPGGDAGASTSSPRPSRKPTARTPHCALERLEVEHDRFSWNARFRGRRLLSSRRVVLCSESRPTARRVIALQALDGEKRTKRVAQTKGGFHFRLLSETFCFGLFCQSGRDVQPSRFLAAFRSAAPAALPDRAARFADVQLQLVEVHLARGGWTRASSPTARRDVRDPRGRARRGASSRARRDVVVRGREVAPRLAGPAPRVASRPARGLSASSSFRPRGSRGGARQRRSANCRGSAMKRSPATIDAKMRQVRSGGVLSVLSVLVGFVVPPPATSDRRSSDVPPLASRVARRVAGWSPPLAARPRPTDPRVSAGSIAKTRARKDQLANRHAIAALRSRCRRARRSRDGHGARRSRQRVEGKLAAVRAPPRPCRVATGAVR